MFLKSSTEGVWIHNPILLFTIPGVIQQVTFYNVYIGIEIVSVMSKHPQDGGSACYCYDYSIKA